jgi:PAS domain S-box-containing protein
MVTENRDSSGIFRQMGFPGMNGGSLILAGLILAVLYYAGLYSFLLFHVLIEIFSVIVAFTIFILAWNTRDKIHNSGLILLGAAYLVIGAVDLLHTLSYKGMGVFKTFGADTATQLWIAARYLESLTLAAAPLFAGRKISMPRAVVFYIVLFILVVATIFIWPVFPTCYVDGVGLTPFKKVSEYVIAAILLISLAILIRQRMHFDSAVFRMLGVSILLTIGSELMFTFYISVYGISNIVGHYLKLASFWLIYKAIIETGLQRPYTLLFRELAQSEKRYRNLVDTLPTGICEFNPDFRITYINPAGLKIIGYEEKDVQSGINLSMILNSEDREKAQRRRDELLQGHTIASTRYRLLRKDEVEADVIVNSTPIYDKGELKTIQTSLTDVTELNRLQRRLQQAEKMEAVALLAGGMAHEINNVLTGVIGHIELIKLKASTQEVSDVDFINVLGGCDRISRLTRHLLAYSRGGRYRSEVIDMAKFIQKVLTDFEEQMSPKIRLSYDLPPGLPKISGDPMQLQMVVSGIVNNAVDAIDAAGSIDVDLKAIDIDAVQSGQQPGMQPGQYVRLRVQDTGKGMDAETLLHIFEPFYTKKFPGRGLGMAAAYGIVKNHGGWIGVDSEPGRGTTVQIYFPQWTALPRS